jgi:hypothetical protein
MTNKHTNDILNYLLRTDRVIEVNDFCKIFNCEKEDVLLEISKFPEYMTCQMFNMDGKEITVAYVNKKDLEDMYDENKTIERIIAHCVIDILNQEFCNMLKAFTREQLSYVVRKLLCVEFLPDLVLRNIIEILKDSMELRSIDIYDTNGDEVSLYYVTEEDADTYLKNQYVIEETTEEVVEVPEDCVSDTETYIMEYEDDIQEIPAIEDHEVVSLTVDYRSRACVTRYIIRKLGLNRGDIVHVYTKTDSIVISKTYGISSISYTVQSDGTLRLGTNVWGRIWEEFPEMLYLIEGDGFVELMKRDI